MKNKRKIISLIISLLVLTGLITQTQANQLEKVNDYYSDEIIVNHVFDGDTVQVKNRGELETVRLIGIDTPETHHPNKAKQCYGEEASKQLSSLINKESISIVSDVISDNTDVYGRILRYVEYEGRDINQELIRKGYGFAMTSFDHSRIHDYKLAQAYAREEKLGLWAECKIIEEPYLQTNEL